MRAGGRTRRRTIDAIVALVVIALVIAVLTRARSNDPRRDETRRKSEPRGAGFERGGSGRGGGGDAARRRDGERTIGGQGARMRDVEPRVRDPRGRGEGGGATKGPVSVPFEEQPELRAARDSRDVDVFERARAEAGRRGPRGRRWEDLERAVPWPVIRSERRRLADPGGDGDGDGGGDASPLVVADENAFSKPFAAGAGASCATACGLCRASCCCDAECRAVGDCCADFEQPGMCVEQKAASLVGGSGGSSAAPPAPPPRRAPSPAGFGFGFGFGFGSGPPPSGPNAPPATPEMSFARPTASASTSHAEGYDDRPLAFPPPPPAPPPPRTDPPSAPTGAAARSVPVAGASSGDVRASLVDPRGTWHSDVSPPAPWYPSRPPVPFPPAPGVPPVPLGVYAKLQAVPRCSPFCDTRAPPPSLPRGDRRWPLAVAAAAEKQWAQLRDLAQIQIGGSGVGGFAFQHDASSVSSRLGEARERVESGRESEGGRGGSGAAGASAEVFPFEVAGGGTGTEAFGPYFATEAQGAELKRHARRAASVAHVRDAAREEGEEKNETRPP